MHVLALDTSTEALSVTLCVDGLCRTCDETGGPRASQRLLPLCAELVQAAGLQFSDLDLIGMGAGPGAFTGLRTAASVAQGLAYALDLPVARVDTLMAQAETAFALLHTDGTVLPDPAQAEPGCVVLAANDARMGELYWELFQSRPDGWHSLHPPAVHPPEQALLAWADILASLPEHADTGALPRLLACGNAWSQHAEGLSAAFASHAGGNPRLSALHRAVLRAVACTPSAAAVARLSLQQHAAGLTVPAAQAQPIYVRDKVAQTTAERELARAHA
ncbi:MAG: tRNA (adenosine(37)-N6)-threonylcarbamoyltransferase complex dimerization subunit type 1 TsaB [Thiomonas sp.]